jgi:hypothetical protein
MSTIPTELLEAADYMANLLEAGEHVAMASLPTAKIATFRKAEKVDIMKLRAFVYQLAEMLRKACEMI